MDFVRFRISRVVITMCTRRSKGANSQLDFVSLANIGTVMNFSLLIFVRIVYHISRCCDDVRDDFHVVAFYSINFTRIQMIILLKFFRNSTEHDSRYTFESFRNKNYLSLKNRGTMQIGHDYFGNSGLMRQISAKFSILVTLSYTVQLVNGHWILICQITHGHHLELRSSIGLCMGLAPFDHWVSFGLAPGPLLKVYNIFFSYFKISRKPLCTECFEFFKNVKKFIFNKMEVSLFC